MKKPFLTNGTKDFVFLFSLLSYKTILSLIYYIKIQADRWLEFFIELK